MVTSALDPLDHKHGRGGASDAAVTRDHQGVLASACRCGWASESRGDGRTFHFPPTLSARAYHYCPDAFVNRTRRPLPKVS